MEQRAAVVTLSNIAQGAAVEIFDHELNKVLENIKDPNADPKKKRKITLCVEFAPYADRSGSEVSIAVKSNLVSVSGVKSNIFVGVDQGEYKAYSHDIRQQELFAEREAAQAAEKAEAIRNVVAMS